MVDVDDAGYVDDNTWCCSGNWTDRISVKLNGTAQFHFTWFSGNVKANTHKFYFLVNSEDKGSFTIQELLGKSRKIEKLGFFILAIDELLRLTQCIGVAKMVSN